MAFTICNFPNKKLFSFTMLELNIRVVGAVNRNILYVLMRNEDGTIKMNHSKTVSGCITLLLEV